MKIIHWRRRLATTNDPVLAQRMAELRSHGIVREPERFEQPPAGPWAYEQQQLGYNYRMSDIQAALGLSQLQRLDELVAERNLQLQFYESLKISLFNYWRYQRMCVRPFGCDPAIKRNSSTALSCLSGSAGCQHRRSASLQPVHLQPYYCALGYAKGHFP